MNQPESADLDSTELERIPPKSPDDYAGDYSGTETQYRPLEEVPVEEPYASFSARFAALLIDSTVIGYLLVVGYRLFGTRLRLPAIDISDWTTLKSLPLLGSIAAVIFAYFFLFEGVLGRTPGKFMCGLSVTHRLGGPPSLLGVVLRNIVRFIDIALFPIAGFGVAEGSERRQRLGDWLGGTTVRQTRTKGHAVTQAKDVEWGSVTRRTIAVFIDMAIFAVTSLFFLLSLPVSRPTITNELLLAGPVLFVAYWILCETIAGGTPAKLFFGLRVVSEDFRPVGVSGSLLRNLFRVLDHNPLGYLCAMLASCKQRPGDIAARTTVIRMGWSLRRFLALIMMIAMISGLGYYGLHNQDSFIRNERVLKIGPWTLPDLPSQMKYYLGMRLKVASFTFGQAKAPALADEPLYTPGEIVYLTAEVSGYITQQNEAWLQQDILVTDPNDETLIDLLNVINKRFPLNESGTQQLSSSFLLPLRIATGQYQVKIHIRDRFGNMIGEAKKSFLVK